MSIAAVDPDYDDATSFASSTSYRSPATPSADAPLLSPREEAV